MADRSLNLGTIFTAEPNQFIRGLRQMREALNKFASGTGTVKNMNTAMRQLGTTAEQTGKKMRGLGTQVRDIGKQMQQTEGVWNRINRALKVTASYGIAATVLFGITKGLRAGAQEIVDYDQALKNLQAITRATNAEVTGMGEVIKDVARTTKFSTGEVAEGMVLLGQAGFTATESMQAMQATADLATGTLSDMKVTTDLLTTTVRAFGLSTVESGRVADVMANSINRSKLTIDKLRISFNFVGAAAAQAGLTLEETAASMGTLANNGLRASTIGTGLRQVLARLLAPNRNLRQEFEAQGIELDKVNPALVGYQQAMKNMTSILVDSETKVVNMTKAYRLFGLRGAQAVAVLARAFASGEYQRMLDMVGEVGTASDMAATQAEGLGVKLKNLADRAKLIAIAFGEAGLVDVLRIFLDILKAITVAIENLARSGLGRIIIQFATFTIALTAAGKAAQLFGRGIGTLLSLLGINAPAALAGFSRGIIGVARSMAIATASAVGLKGAMVATLGPIVAISAAIAAVVVAIKLYTGSTQRSIDATVKQQQQARTAADNLNLYGTALKDLAEKQAKGNDITREHSNTIRRLVVAYPELKDKVSESTSALKQNAEAIKNAYSSELNKNLEKNIELLDLYQTRVKEVTRWVGIKTKVIELAKIAWQGLAWVIEKVIQTMSFFLDLTIRIVTFIPRMFLKLVSGIDPVADALDNLNKRFEDAAKNAKAVKDVNEELAQTFMETADTMREIDPARPVEDIINELRKLGAGEEIIDRITAKWKAQEYQLESVKEAWRTTLDELPNIFKETFEKLDPVRQVDFAKALESMDKEIAAYKKKATEIGIAASDQYAAIARIRAKSLAEFVETSEKETLAAEKRYDLELELIDEFAENIKKRYEERVDIIKEGYQSEIHETRKRGDDIIAIEKRMNEEIKAEREKLGEDLRGIEEEQNRVRRAREEELVKEMVKIQKNLTKEIEKELDNRIKDAEKAIAKADKIGESLAKSGQDALAKIRSAGKAEEIDQEQKYFNDLQSIWNLIDAARKKSFDESKDLYNEAIEKAGDLPRAVEGAHGQTIRTLAETQSQATNIVSSALSEVAARQRTFKAQNEETITDAQTRIDELNQTTQDFAKTYDELSRKKLVLQTEEAVAKIQQTFEFVSKLKAEWDAIKSKTVTLNVKRVETGGGGGLPTLTNENLGARQFGSFKSGGKIEPIRLKVGGAIKSAFGEIQNAMTFVARKTGGWVGKAMSIGQRIAGYGGGDKVKSLLEPGEWVIRKEAVSKYGDRFMEAVNSMNFPTLRPAMATAAENVSRPTVASAPVKMQSGGFISSKGSSGPKLNITIAPRFMTGDRNAARQVAVDIKRALEDLGVRLG